MNKPVVMGTCGYPGSGKSYFSERICNQNNWMHLSEGVIREKIFPTPTYTLDEHKTVFGLMDYLAEEFLKKGVSVIYDANFNFRKSRKKLDRIAKKAKAEYRLIWIQTDEDVAVQRILKRKHIRENTSRKIYGTDDLAVFTLLKNEMELPTKNEPVIQIEGNQPFIKQLESFNVQNKR